MVLLYALQQFAATDGYGLRRGGKKPWQEKRQGYLQKSNQAQRIELAGSPIAQKKPASLSLTGMHTIPVTLIGRGSIPVV
jgi:hypothetical protein